MELKLATPNDFKFGIGDRVEDQITGFEGVIVSRTQWLSNCNTYSVQSTARKDGIPLERQHFDEPQLELITKKEIKEPKHKTGGPERPVPMTNR